METQDESKHRQRIRNHRTGLIILAVILILAILAVVLFALRIGRLNEEQQILQSERTNLLEEQQRQTSELVRSDSIRSQLRVDLEELAAENEEKIQVVNNQAAGLRRRTSENQILMEQLETFRLMEEDFDKVQVQYAQLLGEYEYLDLNYDKLEARYKSLRDSVDQSKGLKALNINILSKWERWLWADRYNVSLARRIDETRITFDIWGSPFTPTGERTVYLSMIDPLGSVMYPTPAETETFDAGNGLPYTKKQEINYSGVPIPVSFAIEHPERLTPGIYTLKVYIDAEPVGSQQLVLE